MSLIDNLIKCLETFLSVMIELLYHSNYYFYETSVILISMSFKIFEPFGQLFSASGSEEEERFQVLNR